MFISQSQVMIAQENAMRPLNSHFPHGALPTLATFRKHFQEARVFRRAQAVPAGVSWREQNQPTKVYRILSHSIGLSGKLRDR